MAQKSTLIETIKRNVAILINGEQLAPVTEDLGDDLERQTLEFGPVTYRRIADKSDKAKAVSIRPTLSLSGKTLGDDTLTNEEASAVREAMHKQDELLAELGYSLLPKEDEPEVVAVKEVIGDFTDKENPATFYDVRTAAELHGVTVTISFDGSVRLRKAS